MSTTFLSTKFGNPAKDQQVINDENGETFYSYGSPVARKTPEGELLLHPQYWNYSRTTNFYRRQFTGYGAPEIRKMIDAGTAKLVYFS